MRIAAIIDTAILSGPGRQLVALASNLAARDVAFLVIAIQRRGMPESPFIHYVRNANVAHVVVPEDHAFDPSVISAVGCSLTDFGADIVQTHGYKPTAIAAALRATGHRWKWIGFWHGATAEDRKVRLYHRLDRALLRFADQVVVMSESQRALFVTRVTPVCMIPNAVLPHRRDQASEADNLERLPRPLLAVIGRLSPEKGVDVFLTAAAILRGRAMTFSAIIVGDGPQRSLLENQARDLGLASCVHFLGTRRSLHEIYGAIDLLVIPSHSEGLPNVLLEALGHDRPVVATTVGAIPNVITSKEVGVLVPPGSPAAIADAIPVGLALRSDPAAALARRHAADAFSLESRVRAHRDLYTSLLAAAGQS